MKTIRAIASIATATLCATAFAACSGSGGGNIASINGQNISRADFDKKLESSPTAKQVLTQMVQQSLVDSYGKDNKIDVAQSEIDKKESDIKAKYPAGQFEQILKQQGLTEADVQNILRQQIIIEKAVAPMVKVSDADIKAYFAKNHATLDKPAQVRARHILVADEKTAQLVESKLKGGAKFEDLAKQYSTDPSTKDKGGELGFFGHGQMVPAFEKAAFSMSAGQISPPVKSPFGWHVIQTEELHPASIATLASAHDSIKETLTQQQEAQQIPVFLQQQRAKANITINDDRFKDAFPPAAPAPAPAASGAAAPAPAASAAPAPATSAK